MSESRFSRALKVWHGSPYDYDHPDLSKVGTGEGAQVYGHGYYVGEAQDTGKTYMEETTAKRRDERNEEELQDLFSVRHHPNLGRFDLYHIGGFLDSASYALRNGDSAEAAKHLKDFKDATQVDVSNLSPEAMSAVYAAFDESTQPFSGRPGSPHSALKRIANGDWNPRAAKEVLAHPIGKFIKELKYKDPGRPVGRLYELEMDVGPHEMLDWDEKLVDHHPEALMKLQKTSHPRWGNNMDYDTDKTGSEFYKSLSDVHGSPAKASEVLKAAGIHAIRYKDQWSRTPVKELRLNGVPIQDIEKDSNHAYGRSGILRLEEQIANRGSSTLKKSIDLVLSDLYHYEQANLRSKDSGAVMAVSMWKNGREWLEKHRDDLELVEKPPTYNYVLFNPDRVRVVQKYDMKGRPVKKKES